MLLYILRHGEAVPAAARDQDRRLTDRGQAELRTVLQARADELTQVRHLLVSPYLRAQQTAAIAREFLDAGVTQATTDELVPEADPQALFNFVEQRRQQQNLEHLMLVGHQPLLGIFFDRLLGVETGRYRLATSSFAAVEADIVAAGLGELRWLSQPVDSI